jgi:hypothetical protein
VPVAVEVLVLVELAVGELVPVDVFDPVLVPVEEAVADALAVCEAVSEPEIDQVDVDVEVEVPVELGLAVFVELALIVDVEVAVLVAVAEAVDVEVAVDVAFTLNVCVSVEIGRTAQLVASEIARNIPPICSPLSPKPILSAVRLLNMTSPPSAPTTYMGTSATLTNSTHSPSFVVPAAGNVKLTVPVAPRVVKTEPKSFGVIV